MVWFRKLCLLVPVLLSQDLLDLCGFVAVPVHDETSVHGRQTFLLIWVKGFSHHKSTGFFLAEIVAIKKIGPHLRSKHLQPWTTFIIEVSPCKVTKVQVQLYIVGRDFIHTMTQSLQRTLLLEPAKAWQSSSVSLPPSFRFCLIATP